VQKYLLLFWSFVLVPISLLILLFIWNVVTLLGYREKLFSASSSNLTLSERCVTLQKAERPSILQNIFLSPSLETEVVTFCKALSDNKLQSYLSEKKITLLSSDNYLTKANDCSSQMLVEENYKSKLAEIQSKLLPLRNSLSALLNLPFEKSENCALLDFEMLPRIDISEEAFAVVKATFKSEQIKTLASIQAELFPLMQDCQKTVSLQSEESLKTQVVCKRVSYAEGAVFKEYVGLLVDSTSYISVIGRLRETFSPLM